MEKTKRNQNGTFAPGHAGGPGRPSRQTEREYMRATMLACPVVIWKQIVERAVTDAKRGDPRAREWLSRYLLGIPELKAPTLLAMAIDEAAGIDPVEIEASDKKSRNAFQNLLPRF